MPRPALRLLRPRQFLGAVTVLLFVVATSHLAAVPQIERDALIALYNSTDGQRWYKKTNWLGPVGTECTWYGVQCSTTGDLTGLVLVQNNLTGRIPQEIGNFSKLRTLRLGINRLGGEIPAEIGLLSALESLSLPRNQLSGSIPPEIGNLTGLVEIALNDNALTGSLPPEFGSLSNLTVAYINQNQLSGSIPPEIGSLVKLQRLDASENQLSGSIPPEIGNLSSLTVLNLPWNNLSGSIPPEIGNLSRLALLSFNSNQLQGSIPPEIGKLSSVRYLDLTNNSIEGPIPPEIGNLNALEDLRLLRNHLTGQVPATLEKLTSLRTLSLGENRLSGRVPSEIGNLTRLETLHLHRNMMTGELPASLTNLTAVSNLMLSYNALHTSDPNVKAWLDKRHHHRFESTQTVAPTGITPVGTTSTSITLRWNPIEFTDYSGRYEVWIDSGAGTVLGGSAAGKGATGLIVTRLSPEKTYTLLVRTITDPNPANQNTVISEFSAPVTAFTNPSVSITDARVTEPDEGTVSAEFVAYLSDPGTKPISVTWVTAAVTAVAGQDYVDGSGTIIFEPGETQKTITVDIIGDLVEEGPETFRVYLTGASNATIEDLYGVCLIDDNDEPICGPAPADLKIDWTGLESGCEPGLECAPGELIRFEVDQRGTYAVQTCDLVVWQFGDGTTATSKDPVTHSYSGAGPYTVTLTVSNTMGSTSDSKELRLGVASKPSVNVMPDKVRARVGAKLEFVGSVTAGGLRPILERDWRVVKVVDGTTVLLRNVKDADAITHTFSEPGSYVVEFRATNAEGISDPAVAEVTIVESLRFEFLLPVIAHLRGANNSRWRSDLHIFNTDPLNGPLLIEFEFRGGAVTLTKKLTVTSSTRIFEDLLEVLASPFPLEDAGPVIVRAWGDSPPLLWTRTYTVDETGVGNFGQFIPAISLDKPQSSDDEPVKWIIPGLEISNRFRANLGVVNPSTESVTVLVRASDDSEFGLPLGEFTVDVPPRTLTQVGDLADRIGGLEPGRKFSLHLTTNGKDPVVYGSLIDSVSNDPVYVQGIRDIEQRNPEKQVQIIPGTGHLEQSNGTWRSDIVILNDDILPIHFDVFYFDGSGSEVAEARMRPLGPNAFIVVEDVLTWPELEGNPGDSFGLIKVVTKDALSKNPIVVQRTYKDRGERGTFGQGMQAISADEANVRVGRPAFIPGVRSDTSYYTNLGLVGLGGEPSDVLVTLLDEAGGQSIAAWRHLVDGDVGFIKPNASIIATNIIRAMSPLATRGTLKIEVLSGGDVWAYASIIAAADPTCGCGHLAHTFDPTYIPAIPMPE